MHQVFLKSSVVGVGLVKFLGGDTLDLRRLDNSRAYKPDNFERAVLIWSGALLSVQAEKT